MGKMIVNILEGCCDFVRLSGRKGYKWSKEQVRGIRLFLQFMMIALGAVMVLGVICAWTGYVFSPSKIGWIKYIFSPVLMMWIGRLLIALSALLAAAGLLVVWLRASVLSEVLVIAAAVIKKIPIPVLNLPDLSVVRPVLGENTQTGVRLDAKDFLEIHHADLGIDQAKADKFLRMIMAVMAWIALVGVYSSVVPVYKDPIAFMVALTLMFFLAYATVGWNKGSEWSKTAVYWGMIILLGVTTLNFFGNIVYPGGVAAIAVKAWVFAKGIYATSLVELHNQRFAPDKRFVGMLYVYGVLGAFSLLAFIFSAVYFARASDGIKKTVPAAFAILALAGLSYSGWYMLMSKTYAGVKDKVADMAQADTADKADLDIKPTDGSAGAFASDKPAGMPDLPTLSKKEWVKAKKKLMTKRGELVNENENIDKRIKELEAQLN